MDEITNALSALENAKIHKLTEVAQIEAAIKQLQSTILVVAAGHIPQSVEYKGLGIVDAAKRWLHEVGEAKSTREIADALMARGLVTRSKNFTPTVYSTLTNSGELKRTSDGKWDIKARKEGGR